MNRIVFASSGGTVYGNSEHTPFAETTPPHPISAYGVNKLAAEHYLKIYNRNYGMKNLALRIANPFGRYQHGFKNQGVIPIFARKALSGERLKIWGDGSVTRDYIFGADVAQAMAISARYDGKEEVFNIGSGVGRSLNEVITDLSAVLGRKIEVDYADSRGFDVPVSVLDCSLAKQELGWSATSSWLTSLRITCDWIRQDMKSASENGAGKGPAPVGGRIVR